MNIDLRDYFAGQALISLLIGNDVTEETIAKASYKIADAMIAEKAKYDKEIKDVQNKAFTKSIIDNIPK